MNVLSFGGGVDSTALLVLTFQGKIELNAVVFADTGCELPETYNHVSFMEKLCKQNNLQFHRVSKGNLYEDNFQRKIFPYRVSRSCTDKFKIRPMHKFAKQNWGTDIIWFLGFDYGERNRAKKYPKEIYRFPLIEMKINRRDCKKIIKDFGLKVPVKSGCFFCPFTKVANWKRLYLRHPDLFKKAITLEENGRSFPEYTIGNKPLRTLGKAIGKGQVEMCNWVDTEDEPCVYCHD